MPFTPHQEDNMTAKPPSPRQLNYLKALANRAGQTFTYPATSLEASKQIRRLKTVRETGFTFAETQAKEAVPREAHGDGAVIQPWELAGYGSNCRWSH